MNNLLNDSGYTYIYYIIYNTVYLYNSLNNLVSLYSPLAPKYFSVYLKNIRYCLIQ